MNGNPQYPAGYSLRKRRSQTVAFAVFRTLSLLVVMILFAILGFIIVKGAGVLSWDFLTKAPEDGMTSGGIFPAIVGTLLLMAGSAVVSFPIGIMSGIYMNEYASRGWVVKFIRLMTNNLSGVPSIVFGLFGMALFVKYLGFGDSILAGSLTLGLLSLPLVIRTTEEARGGAQGHSRGDTRGQPRPGRHQATDHLEGGAAHGHAPRDHRADTLARQGLRRDRAHPLHLRGLLLSAAARVDIRPVHGAALPPLRDFDQRHRHRGPAA